MSLPIEGVCEPEFHAVAETFRRNFLDRGEVGAAVCVYRNGRKVVDLWGGYRDAKRSQYWLPDTLVNVMSVTKGMGALCAHALIEDGKMKLSNTVATYWPEFAQAGKSAITVQQLLSHHAALIYADALYDGAMFDWEAVIRAIEVQPPEWEPGTLGAYHSSTYGFLVGELIRRVSGKTTPQILKERFTGPLGVEFYIGMTPEQSARAAEIITNPGSVSLKAFADPSTKLGRAQKLRDKRPDLYNSKAYHEGYAPSSNGHSNARSVARIYAALAQGGEIDGVRVLREETIRTLGAEQWDNICGLTDRHFRLGMGLFLSCPPLAPFGPNPNAFGHAGVGGALGFGDPEAKLAFSYTPNFMCAGAGVGERCEALIDAAFGAL
jgi:CubicO group peptidase (beta-lactamase class C family)